MKKLLAILILVLVGLAVTPAGRALIELESFEPNVPISLTETGDYAQELAAADNVLREMLFDYGTARINWDLALVDGTITVRVNAKNQFGGYVGFKTYTFRRGVIQ